MACETYLALVLVVLSCLFALFQCRFSLAVAVAPVRNPVRSTMTYNELQSLERTGRLRIGLRLSHLLA
jgi:hypothetical protein